MDWLLISDEKHAAAILAIPVNEPERLFQDSANVKGKYLGLLKLWHPDTNPLPQASAVMTHINALHDEAEKKLAAGVWETPGLMKLRSHTGKTFDLRYRKKHAFALGEMVYGDKIAAFLVRNEFADLFENARRRIGALKYASPDMQKEIGRYMPKVLSTFETDNGLCVMVIEKTPDVFALRDVLEHLGGKMDPRHVAWVMNSIYNLLSYLEWAGVTHNDISLDSVFVSPEFHSTLLLGGWWYGAERGAKLNALPSRSYGLAPYSMTNEKIAHPQLDLACIRTLGCELLGHANGMALATDSTVPAPIVKYLRGPTSGSARKDYRAWGEDALKASFGPRRFVKLEIKASDIFK